VGDGSVSEEATKAVVRRARQGHRDPAPARRLLIVDDEPDLTLALQMLLQHPDLEIHIAADGVEALERAHETRPDAILLDYMLPAMDGLEVFRRLRLDSALRSTRVIMLSASAQPSTFRTAMALGAHDCIRKPFSSGSLRQIVHDALALGRTEARPLASAGQDGASATDGMPVLKRRRLRASAR